MKKLFNIFSSLIISATFLLSSLIQPTLAATNFPVQAGTQIMKNAVIASKFYPETITINEGDSITFKVVGDAHTVTFLSGNSAPSPFTPEGANPSGGNTYNGTGIVNSGILFPGQTFTLTFTKAGTYDYQCLIHPDMKGKVIVQAASSQYPNNNQLTKATNKLTQINDLNTGLSLLSSHATPNPTQNSDGSTNYFIDTGTGDGTNSIMRFLPDFLTLQEGDTITFKNPDPMMPHTVTFPGPDGQVYDLPDPRAFQAFGTSTFDGSQLTSSGILMHNQTFTLKFTKAGSYNFECVFHDDLGMHGKILVLKKF